MADIFVALFFMLKYVGYGLVVLFSAVVLYLFRVHSRLSHIPGPPRSSFFLGNVLEIRETRKKEGKIIHCILSRWSTEYRPVFVIWFFHVPLIIVSDADVVRNILVVKNLPKDPFGYARFQYVFGQRFLGNGPLTDLNHETWEAKRKVVVPLLNRNKLVIDDLPTMSAVCENFMKRLESLADGTTEISMTDEFFAVTLGTILKMAFSITMDGTDRESFHAHFQQALNGITLSFRSPFTFYQLWSKQRKECRDGAQYSRKVVKGVLEQRQKDLQAGNSVPKDFLDHVLKMKDTIPGCDLEDLVDLAVTVVFGGMETMGNHMAFTLLSICLYPDVEKRVREELDAIIGERTTVTAKDLESLPYLDMVIKESLRLHPPTPAITRVTKEDTLIGGVVIPANIPIMVNAFVLHHHPDYWNNPEEFNPDRFNKEAALTTGAYIPFSLGARRCPGVQLAQLEEKLMLAKLLTKFSFKLIPGQSLEVAENHGFALGGFVRCTITPLVK